MVLELRRHIDCLPYDFWPTPWHVERIRRRFSREQRYDLRQCNFGRGSRKWLRELCLQPAGLYQIVRLE